MRLGCLVLLLVGMAAPAGAAPEPGWHATVRAFAKAHFHNPAWGFSHAERDYRLARRLAAADHVVLDPDVIFAAAYLHDIAAFPPWEKPDPVDHSDQGAAVVAAVLKGTGFPMAKIDAVRAAIRTHMFYRTPKAPEALYLHDADALDWLGAIGIARVVALADPDGGDPDGPAVMAMVKDYLVHVPSRILSPAGRAMAGGRVAETKRFLGELGAESDGLKTL